MEDCRCSFEHRRDVVRPGNQGTENFSSTEVSEVFEDRTTSVARYVSVTFARIGAVMNLKVEDYFQTGSDQ
jgi:hypothetical protein